VATQGFDLKTSLTKHNLLNLKLKFAIKKKEARSPDPASLSTLYLQLSKS
jgi:hypothetical protein